MDTFYRLLLVFTYCYVFWKSLVFNIAPALALHGTWHWIAFNTAVFITCFTVSYLFAKSFTTGDRHETTSH